MFMDNYSDGLFIFYDPDKFTPQYDTCFKYETT